MYVTLFIILLGLALILIALGLFKTEHTELALVGFVFLFMLSFLILSNDITLVTGTTTNSSFSYSNVSNYTLLTSSVETVANIYSSTTLDSTMAHTVGYWLAICSVVGFVGVFWGLRKRA